MNTNLADAVNNLSFGIHVVLPALIIAACFGAIVAFTICANRLK